VKAKELIFLQAAAIVSAGFWVFWPAIHGGWIWDDFNEIVYNHLLSDPAGIRKIWFSPDSLDYFPLKATAQWVEWHLWGDQVTGYHLVNIGLHLLSAFLLWNLLGKLGVRLAWLGALLFAVHPLVVESVAWISEFKNTLSLPPLLLAMLLYIDYDTKHDAAERDRNMIGLPSPTYLLSFICFLAAMLCKSSVVMFPVVLLIYCWWKRGSIGRADLLASAPFFAVSVALGSVSVWFQQRRAIAGTDLLIGGFLPRCAAAGQAAVFYLWKYLIPVDLMPIYPRWTLSPSALWQFWPWVTMAGIFVCLLMKRSTWSKHALFGFGVYLVNLIPVLGFVPMAYLRISRVADHFAYLPLIGLIGLTIAVFRAFDRRKLLYCIPLYLLIAAAAWQSHRYVRIFLNAETLLTYTLEHNPNAWIAHVNLGNALARSGRLPEAIAHYEAALRLRPDYVVAHHNLGSVLAQVGRLPEAIAHFETALRLAPDNLVAQNDLGNALARSGQFQTAITHYEAALRLEPNDIDVRCNLGIALVQIGQLPEAIGQFEKALQLKPNYVDAHYGLGVAFMQIDRLPEAEAEFEKALSLQPRYRPARVKMIQLRAAEAEFQRQD